MKTARELFEELGYDLRLFDDETIIYRKKNDYEDNIVFFHIGNFLPKTYEVRYTRWIETGNALDWIPMEQRRDEFDKHCAKYGRWEREDAVIYSELHKTINKQVEELGGI